MVFDESQHRPNICDILTLNKKEKEIPFIASVSKICFSPFAQTRIVFTMNSTFVVVDTVYGAAGRAQYGTHGAGDADAGSRAAARFSADSPAP